MQQMFNICDTYANDHGLMFNAKKRDTITVLKSSRRPFGNICFTLGEQTVASRERIYHLGVILDGKETRNGSSTQEKCRKFCGAVNSVVARLGGVCGSDKI